MVCQFWINGKAVYIRAESIVGVLPHEKPKSTKVVNIKDTYDTPSCLVYVEDPIGTLLVNQSIEEVVETWVGALLWDHELPESEETGETEEPCQPM
jgi:hypothetical protein